MVPLALAVVLPHISGCTGWSTWTTSNREEISKITTIAVLTDATVQDPMSETPAAIDIPMNMNIARAVTDFAQTHLSIKGFTPVREECRIFVGAIVPPHIKILAKKTTNNIYENGLIALDPPAAVEPASFQENIRPLAAIFRQWHGPAPKADFIGDMNEAVREKRHLSQVRETGLQSDALMVIKINGRIHRKKEPTLVDEFFMSVIPGLSIIYAADLSPEGINMEVLFVNVKSEEVLWSGSFFQKNPDIEELKGFVMYSVNELSSHHVDTTRSSGRF